jgi:hypothetical protein
MIEVIDALIEAPPSPLSQCIYWWDRNLTLLKKTRKIFKKKK